MTKSAVGLLKKDGDHVRQGDLLVIKRDRFPDKYNEPFSVTQNANVELVAVPDKVIHEGEKSGHKHELKANRPGMAQVYVFAMTTEEPSVKAEHKPVIAQMRNEDLAPRWEATVKYMQLFETTELVHPEHEAIAIPKGIYEVTRQREETATETQTLVED